jgi:hypothetical protein
LLRHRQVAIGRSSNNSGVALVVVATPTTIAKAYDAMPRFCKSKTHFPTLSRKVLSKTLPTQASATPPNEKVFLFLILQLFWAYCSIFRVLKQGQNLVVLLGSIKLDAPCSQNMISLNIFLEEETKGYAKV